MKTAKVIGFYILDNFIHNSKDMKIKVSFKDRLKFLLFGENTVFRFSDVDIKLNSTSKVFSLKGTPMKPIDRIMFMECPRCGNVEILHCAHCPECGQKLDWGEEP